MKLNPEKPDGWGYRMVTFRNPNFNRFTLTQPCDGWTYGQTGDSKVSRAKKIDILNFSRHDAVYKRGICCREVSVCFTQIVVTKFRQDHP